MKRKLRTLVLAVASLSLLGGLAPAQQPPAESAPAETKPESNTGPLRIGAAVALLVILGVIIMRRKGKKKTDEEF